MEFNKKKKDWFACVPYEYKGIAILCVLIFSRWPLHIYSTNRNFLFSAFSSRLSSAQKLLVYKKNLKLSLATNKTASSGEILNIYNNDCSCHSSVFDSIGRGIKTVV